MLTRLAIVLAGLVLAAPARAEHLRIVDLRTGAVTVRAEARSWSYLTWRRDGTLAATAANRVVLVPPGGAIATVRDAWSTALSPIGDRLATLRPAGSSGERLEIRAVSGELLARRRIRGSETALAWRRDGARLALGWSTRRGDYRISILGPRLKALRTFRVPAAASFSTAAWAPDGRSLTVVTRPDRTLAPVPREIRRLDLTTGGQTVCCEAHAARALRRSGCANCSTHRWSRPTVLASRSCATSTP